MTEWNRDATETEEAARAEILADFRSWSGGFEPDETSIEERCDYITHNYAEYKHAELFELFGVPTILGKPIRD